MKQSANDDIQNLFRKFGGDPDSYQEIKRTASEEQAQQNWPIVVAIKNEFQDGHRSGAENRPMKLPSAAAHSASRFPILKRTNPQADEPQHGDAGSRLVESPVQPSSATPLSALFASERGDSVLIGTQKSSQPESVKSYKDEALGNVFKRLSNSRLSEGNGAPQNNLRSLLGLMKKQ